MGSTQAATDTSYRRVPLARANDGDPFLVPADACAWRVRRFKNPGKPGACELVYGDDAGPLEIGIETPIAEFRESVGARPGRYRLDAIDEDGVAVAKLPPAYLQIDAVAEVRNANAMPPAPADPTLEALREVLKSNAELVKLNAEMAGKIGALAGAVIEHFPSMMDSASTLLRAADGAGLPHRAPLDQRNAQPAVNDNQAEDDYGDEVGADGWPTAITQMVGQLLPMVQAFVAHRMGTSNLRNSADPETRPATPAPAEPTPRPAPTAAAPSAPPADPVAPASRPPTSPAPMPTPDQLAHFAAVQAGLTSREAQIAAALAMQLQPAERAAWLGELAALPVPDAIALIRSHLAQTAPPAAGP